LLFDPDLLKKAGIFSLVSGELLACIGGGYWLGKELDKRWNTGPWLMSTLAMLGLVYSVWRIYGLAQQWIRKP
jgi:F0F1-type ATP synthase assembly protein I